MTIRNFITKTISPLQRGSIGKQRRMKGVPLPLSLSTATSLKSSSSFEYSTTFLDRRISNNWLDDPSTYPLIAILAATVSFALGAGVHALTSFEEVQISPTKRNSTMQYWGKDQKPHLVSRWNKEGDIYHGPEGIGIDHEDWKKNKEKYYLHLKKKEGK